MKTSYTTIARLLALAVMLMSLQGCAAVAVGAAKTAVKVPVAVGGAVVDMAVETDKEKAAKEIRISNRPLIALRANEHWGKTANHACSYWS